MNRIAPPSFLDPGGLVPAPGDDTGWLAAFLQRAPWAILVWRLVGSPGDERIVLVGANDLALRWIRPDLQSLAGRTIDEIFPDGSPDVVAQITETARHQGTRRLPGVRYRERHMDLALIGLPGRVVAAVVELPGDAGAAEAGEGLFADFYHNAPCGFHSLDAEGRFVRINDTELQWLGYAREELIGRPMRALIPSAEGREAFREHIERLTRDGQVDGVQVEMSRRDGTRLTLLVSSRAHHDGAGKFLCSSSIALDMTPLRRMEDEKRRALEALRLAKEDAEARVEERSRELQRAHEALSSSLDQLRHAQKMDAIGRLAGGVAHDFNNILCAVLSFASIIHEDLPEGSPLRADARQIRLAAERARELTRQLLIFSRQEIVTPVSVDTGAALRDLEAMIRCLAGDAVEVEIRAAQDTQDVWIARSHFDQIVVNLAVNARDAMPGGGKLLIETAEVVLEGAHTIELGDGNNGPHLMLSVSDTGVGMDAETRGRIFEPYFTTKLPGKGTGLGLATVYGIVKQCGGSIEVESRPGHGASFRLYFPITSRKVDSARLRTPAPAPRGKEVILLVEDDEAVRRAAEVVLRRQGYLVQAAQNGREALALAQASPDLFDLVLTDVAMPSMNGRELAERMAELQPRTPVLFMSGYTDDAAWLQGVADGTLDYLAKPFAPSQLCAKVRDVLDRSGNETWKGPFDHDD